MYREYSPWNPARILDGLHTVVNPAETECPGCLYISPTDARWFADGDVTEISGASWSDFEAMALFWVRKSGLPEGLDRRLLESMIPWLEHEWAFGRHLIVTNEQFEQQVAMIGGTHLELQFRIKLPKDPGPYLAYA